MDNQQTAISANSKVVLREGTLPSQELLGIINQFMEQFEQKITICTQSLNAENGEWEQGMTKILPKVQEWHGKNYLFRKNKYPLILRDISEVRFTQLALLALQDNNIQSIQGLCRIYMPLLHSFGLERNCVNSIRNMRKHNCLKLRKLGIAANFIRDSEQIVNFQSSSISMIALETYSSQQQSADIGWLAKLNSPNLLDTYLMYVQRIKNKTERVLTVIRRKHKNIDVLLYKPDINLQIKL